MTAPETPTPEESAATAAWESMVDDLAPVIQDHLPRSMRDDVPLARHLAVAIAFHLEMRGLIRASQATR